MKKSVLIFGIIFSLLIISGGEYEASGIENEFIKLERQLVEEFEFHENGIKIEYEIEEKIDKELLRIEEILLNENTDSVSKFDNTINISNDEYSIEVKILEDIVNKVHIVILNKNEELSVKKLRQVLNSVVNEKIENYREYLYVKIKIDKDIEDLDELYNRVNIEKIEILEIDNGKAINGTLKNNMKINLGEINYNTGKYLIVGTPVIFTEY